MKNFTLKKVLFFAVIFSISSGMVAQFRLNTNTNIGQTYDLDETTGISTFLVHFNTEKAASSWSLNEETNEITISISKCQTQRGLQANVYDEEGNAVVNSDFECRGWNQNRNPARVSSMASLFELLDKYSEKDPEQTSTFKWKPAHCLFDVAENDCAFGAYPGKYKVVKYGFQFDLSGSAINDDITFEIDTYDVGNTGETATYKLIVSTGSEGNVIKEIESFYVTGSGKKSVKLAEEIGETPSVFTNKKLFIKIETEGTGTEIDEAKYDPTIVIDNFSVNMNKAIWTTPAAGATANEVFNNESDPATGIVDEDTQFNIVLKTENRIGALKIVDDLQDKSTRYITFLEEGAVKANDGEGNYTVDVDYTLTPAVYENYEWTKATIEVSAPASGTVNDDIKVFFTAKPKATVRTTRFELDCGTRIWYDFSYIAGEQVGIKYISNDNGNVYPNPASNVATFSTSINSVIKLYTLTGQLAKTVIAKSNAETVDLSDLNNGVYLYVIETDNNIESGKITIIK